MELVELTNSETAAATPPGEGAKSLRSPSLLENGRCWRFLVNYPSYIYTIPSGMVFGTQSSQGHHQGHHQSGKSDENRSSEPNQIAPSVYIKIELCYYSLDQWKNKIHLLWGICFNIPHWPRSHLTNGRLQHIKELVRLAACEPHVDPTLALALPLTIDVGMAISITFH